MTRMKRVAALAMGIVVAGAAMVMADQQRSPTA
jgi:hypothetical protein